MDEYSALISGGLLPAPCEEALAPELQTGLELPALIVEAGPKATKRFLEFFTVNIRNANTRRAYGRACLEFLTWCEKIRVTELSQIEPMMVAAYIERKTKVAEAQTVKQSLAALKMLFDWLVVGQVIAVNPAAAVKGPKSSTQKGKTPVLNDEDTRVLLDGIDTSHVVGLRDRAMIGLMAHSFARVGALVQMNVGDYYKNGKKWWVRLHEKGGKFLEMPVHHKAEEFLDAYLEAAGIRDDEKGPLFRTSRGRSHKLTDRRLCEREVLYMIKRRAGNVGLSKTTCCHTFRATGITNYLTNGGRMEKAKQMAGHASEKTTGLYDRRSDQISVDEVERINFY